MKGAVCLRPPASTACSCSTAAPNAGPLATAGSGARRRHEPDVGDRTSGRPRRVGPRDGIGGVGSRDLDAAVEEAALAGVVPRHAPVPRRARGGLHGRARGSGAPRLVHAPQPCRRARAVRGDLAPGRRRVGDRGVLRAARGRGDVAAQAADRPNLVAPDTLPLVRAVRVRNGPRRDGRNRHALGPRLGGPRCVLDPRVRAGGHATRWTTGAGPGAADGGNASQTPRDGTPTGSATRGRPRVAPGPCLDGTPATAEGRRGRQAPANSPTTTSPWSSPRARVEPSF